MRFLLISDTHGQLSLINELAERTKADAIIHAGDFGFYGNESYDRLSERELRLLIVHSDLSQEKKDQILALSQDKQVAAARDHSLVGEFQAYIDGTESFRVPVYAVWGNHEDKEIVERLYRGDLSIPNLNILHHESVFRIKDVLIFGLGGNFLPGSKMLQKPIAGGGGKIWTTLSQYADLVRAVDAESEATKLRMFVSHVSPGKEPFVEFMGARTGASYTVSGHMGAPTSMVWNAFAIQSIEDSASRIQSGVDAVKAICLESDAGKKGKIDEAFDLIGKLPDDAVHIGRGVKAPRWYRSMTHINLPDAHVGYGLLDVDGNAARFQSFNTGTGR